MNKFLTNAWAAVLWCSNQVAYVATLLFCVVCFLAAIAGAGIARMAGSAATFCGDNSAERVSADILGYEDDEEETETEPKFGIFYVEHARHVLAMVIVASTGTAAKLIASNEEPNQDWQDATASRIGTAADTVTSGVIGHVSFRPQPA